MKIDLDHITLNYKREGSGKSVILLHGNGEDLTIFNRLVNKLKNNYTTYAVDSRNHGESSKTNNFSYEAMATDIYNFITELNLTDVSLVGFSDGAIIGIQLALQYKNLFNKLVLMGPNLKPTDLNEEAYKWIEAEYKKTNSPLFELMLTQPNIELESLKVISVPTLVIGGENDIFKDNVLPEISQTIPNSQLLIIKGHDHASYIIDEDLLAPQLIEFLQ